jgi:hypothetical protein
MSYETLARRTDEQVRAESLYLHALRILPRPPADEAPRRRLIAVGSRRALGGCATLSAHGLEPRSTAGSIRVA